MSNDFAYHYCSTDVFRNIVETGEIWLTNIFYMNDPGEHRWLRCIAQRVLKQDYNTCDEQARLLEKLFPSEDQTEVYCCCFSKDYDSLSQWRAYGDNGRGIAFGFSWSVLRSMRGNEQTSGRRLEHVVYDQAEQERIVRESLPSPPSQSADPPSHSLPPDLVRDLPVLVAKSEMWFDAARCKRPAFSQESEVRLIYDPHLATDSSKLGAQRFRCRDGLLVPYYALPIPKNACDAGINPRNTAPIYHVMFGPKSEHARNRAAAERLFATSGYDTKRIKFDVSAATLR